MREGTLLVTGPNGLRNGAKRLTEIREEVRNMNYQKITLIGKVTMDAKKKRSQDGATPYTTFTVP